MGVTGTEQATVGDTAPEWRVGAAERRLGRNLSLDGLRGATVIIVFCSHLEIILPIPSFTVVPGGTVSLDSFFVLSGFLITALLLREQARTGGIRWPAFYRRRGLRLLPPLAAVLLGQMIFATLSGVSFHDEWTSVLSVGFYYSNWKLAFNSNAFGGHIANGLQHLWSLSLEEQFYLLWPFVTIVFLTINRRLRTVVVVLVALIALIAVHRGLMYHGVNSWYATFIRTDTRADGILLGCLMAHIWIRGRMPRRGLPLMATIASVFLIICLPIVKTGTPFLYHGGIVLIDVACAMIIAALVEARWAGRHFFGFKPFVWLGVVSYAFYLWHLPVFFAIHYYGGYHWNPALRVFLAVSITLLFTALSWHLLEKPLLEWKDRLEGKDPVERLSLQALVRRERRGGGKPQEREVDNGGREAVLAPALAVAEGALVEGALEGDQAPRA